MSTSLLPPSLVRERQEMPTLAPQADIRTFCLPGTELGKEDNRTRCQPCPPCCPLKTFVLAEEQDVCSWPLSAWAKE